MIRNGDPPVHVQNLLNRLRTLPKGESTSFCDFAEHYQDELHGFEWVMNMVAQGEPIYLDSWEGRWMNFTSSESLYYRRAYRPEELDDFEKMLVDQQSYIGKLLDGVDLAKKRLHEVSVAD